MTKCLLQFYAKVWVPLDKNIFSWFFQLKKHCLSRIWIFTIKAGVRHTCIHYRLHCSLFSHHCWSCKTVDNLFWAWHNTCEMRIRIWSIWSDNIWKVYNSWIYLSRSLLCESLPISYALYTFICSILLFCSKMEILICFSDQHTYSSLQKFPDLILTSTCHLIITSCTLEQFCHLLVAFTCFVGTQLLWGTHGCWMFAQRLKSQCVSWVWNWHQQTFPNDNCWRASLKV